MTAVEIVQSQVDAFSARDAVAFAKHYSANARLLLPDGSVMLDGHDAIESFYAAMFDSSPDIRVEIGSRIAAGDWVIDEEFASGIVVDGFPPDIHGAVVYHISDGRIDQVQMFM